MIVSKSFVFRFGDVEVREREFALINAGEVLPVEPKAFRVLLILLRNPHKLISKEELLNAVWGDIAVGDNSLARSIALLRRLLGDETRNPRYIETVATVGYRWLCPVEQREDLSYLKLLLCLYCFQTQRPTKACDSGCVLRVRSRCRPGMARGVEVACHSPAFACSTQSHSADL